MNIYVRYIYYLKTILLLFVLLNTGCESNLNLEITDSSQILTVNCILREDDSIRVEITKSLPYKSLSDTSTFIKVKDASVVMTDKDVLTTSLVYQERKDKVYDQIIGAYVSPNTGMPVSDHSYEIKINIPGYKEITSSTILPQPVPILSVDTSSVYIKNGKYSYKVLVFAIRFKDPPNTLNYYKLSVDRFGRYKRCLYGPFNCKTYIIKRNASFICYDNNVICQRKSFNSPGFISLELEEEEVWYNEVFISDNGFDGNTYELKVYIRPDWLTDVADPPSGENFTNRAAYIRLYSINEEYYKYSKSYFDQLYRSNDMFSEPIPVYSNISNGTGIFSGASVSIDSSITTHVHYSTFFK